MRGRQTYKTYEEAKAQAQAIAARDGLPVWWGQHPAQRWGYTVPLTPCGDPRETMYLMLPPREQRQGEPWMAAVLNAHERLVMLREQAREKKWLEHVAGLTMCIEHLVARLGFLPSVFEGRERKVVEEYLRGSAILADALRNA